MEQLEGSIEWVVDEICGKNQMMKKQNWITADILRKMEERRISQIQKDEERYKRLKHEIQKLCREAKDKYYEDKCREIEMWDRTHNQLLYKKRQEMRPRRNRMVQMIRSKQCKCIIDKEEALERWAEYLEELYSDGNRGDADMGDLVHEVYTISSEEIETVIKELPKGKACGSDNIAADLIQSMGEKGMEVMSRLINKIYKSGQIPEDLRKSIFVPVPKINRAQKCSDFKTIALI